jgi:deoxycytidylate deaminase
MLSRRERAYLRVALKIAQRSTCRQRHGAVIVVGGRVLATATNRTRNHPDALGDTPNLDSCTSYHAECVAIRLVRSTSLKRATLYVARINGLGQERLSRPCTRCAALIKTLGIAKVVYTL